MLNVGEIDMRQEDLKWPGYSFLWRKIVGHAKSILRLNEFAVLNYNTLQRVNGIIDFESKPNSIYLILKFCQWVR